jgi:hypothetical protein
MASAENTTVVVVILVMYTAKLQLAIKVGVECCVEGVWTVRAVGV